MSEIKQKVLSEKEIKTKLVEHKNVQYDILQVLMNHDGAGNLAKLELHSKVSPLAVRLKNLQNELGGNVQQLTEKTPAQYADFHGNKAQMHIRSEGERLVLSTMLNKELGESKYPMIKVGIDGSVEISENQEMVTEIFANPQIKDIREINLDMGDVSVTKEDLRNFHLDI